MAGHPNLTSNQIAFKNERINGWLEDMLVTAKRGELMTAIRKAYRELPAGKEQEFIDALDDTTKHYIARDTNYMNVIRFGEEIRRANPYQDKPYILALAARRKEPRDRNTIMDPGAILKKWRHIFNHPETEDMQEYTREEIAGLFAGAKEILNRAFYPHYDFTHTKKPFQPQEEEEQVPFRPGTLITNQDMAGPAINTERHAALHQLAYVASRCHAYSPTFKKTSFDALLGRAIDYRQVRVGALLNAIHFEKNNLGEKGFPIFDTSFSNQIFDTRVRLSHYYDNIGYTKTIFTQPETLATPISEMILNEMEKRNYTPQNRRLAKIPDPDTLIEETLKKIGVWKPPAEKTDSRRRFLQRKPMIQSDDVIAASFRTKLSEKNYVEGGNGEIMFSFEPASEKTDMLLTRIQNFFTTHNIYAEIDAAANKVHVMVPAYEMKALQKAVKPTPAKPVVEGRDNMRG